MGAYPLDGDPGLPRESMKTKKANLDRKLKEMGVNVVKYKIIYNERAINEK